MFNFKQLWYLTIGVLLLIVVSIFFIDQPLSMFIDQHGKFLQRVFSDLTAYTEIAVGYPVSKYLGGAVVLVVGLIFWVIDRRFARAKYFVFISLTHLTSRFVVTLLKNVFQRSRPSHFLDTQEYGNTFGMMGGESFPSGHVAHFLGLFLPIVVLFPRIWILLLIVPTYISLGRIILNLHYLSDILASVYIVIVCTSIFGYLLNIIPGRGVPYLSEEAQ